MSKEFFLFNGQWDHRRHGFHIGGRTNINFQFSLEGPDSRFIDQSIYFEDEDVIDFLKKLKMSLLSFNNITFHNSYNSYNFDYSLVLGEFGTHSIVFESSMIAGRTNTSYPFTRTFRFNNSDLPYILSTISEMVSSYKEEVITQFDNKQIAEREAINGRLFILEGQLQDRINQFSVTLKYESTDNIQSLFEKAKLLSSSQLDKLQNVITTLIMICDEKEKSTKFYCELNEKLKGLIEE